MYAHMQHHVTPEDVRVGVPVEKEKERETEQALILATSDHKICTPTFESTREASP